MKTIFRYLPYTVFVIVMITLAILIPGHSGWCLSDDYLVYGRTGLGHPFLPSYQFAPQLGRFFPTAYLPYNILLLFHSGFIPAYDHYVFLAICFVLTFVILCLLFVKIRKETCEKGTFVTECILLFALLILMPRSIEGFMTLFSTFGISCLLFTILLFVFFTFSNSKTILSGAVLCVLSIWLTFASESNFVVLITIGCCAFIFNGKNLHKKEKIVYSSLISIAVLFLVLYFFLIFLHTTDRYDSSHGSPLTLWENALAMVRSTKVFWLAIPLFLYRICGVVTKKSEYEPFYDATLFTGIAMLAANVVLRTNMSFYYFIPSLYCMPSIIHFAIACNRKLVPFTILFFMAVFYTYKLPGIVSKQYLNRDHDTALVEELLSYEDDGYEITWVDIDGNLWAYLVFNDIFRFKKNNDSYQLTDFYGMTELNEKTLVLSHKRIEDDQIFLNKLKSLDNDADVIRIDKPNFEHPSGFTFYEIVR